MLSFLDELRALGQTGLHYAKDEYDKERYRRLIALVSEQYSNLSSMTTQIIANKLFTDIGYATAKVGVQGVLFDDDGRILLERRSDDNLWGLPSGWVDVCETPEETIVKEFYEETSLRVKAGQLIGHFTRKPGDFGDIHSSVLLLFNCDLVGGEIAISHECHEARFAFPNEITDWHKDHGKQVDAALRYRRESLCRNN